jgi:hypothetical protein
MTGVRQSCHGNSIVFHECVAGTADVHGILQPQAEAFLRRFRLRRMGPDLPVS